MDKKLKGPGRRGEELWWTGALATASLSPRGEVTAAEAELEPVEQGLTSGTPLAPNLRLVMMKHGHNLCWEKKAAWEGGHQERHPQQRPAEARRLCRQQAAGSHTATNPTMATQAQGQNLIVTEKDTSLLTATATGTTGRECNKEASTDHENTVHRSPGGRCHRACQGLRGREHAEGM